MVDSSFLFNDKKQIVPFSPALDFGLSGGIPEGSWVRLSGTPKSGKSTSSIHFALNALKLDKQVYYINVEGRVKPELNLLKLRYSDDFHIIQSTIDHIFTAEEFLLAIEDIIRLSPGCVIIIDSISSLCSSSEMSDSEFKAQFRADAPRLFAKFCRRNANTVPVMKTIIIAINHLALVQGGNYSYYSEDGGMKLQYQADVHLRIKKHSPWVVKDKQIGQKINWEVMCSALGPPGNKVEGYLRYGEGLDETMETINLAVDFGLIKQSKSWYTLEFLEEKTKVHGEDAVYNYLSSSDNLDKLHDLQKKVQSYLV